MPVTSDQMVKWCGALLGEGNPSGDLDPYLSAIPRLESLADLPSATPVLVRGDVDAKPGAEVGQGDIRLQSMVETLKFGQEKGWKQIIFGHIGRDPAGSLVKVAKRIGALLGCDVHLIENWLAEDTVTIYDHVSEKIAALPAGSVVVLENTRRYEIERCLWEAKPKDLPDLAGDLARLASQFAEKIADVYVNEALSAGSLDASTTVVPAAMSRIALGKYIAAEFEKPMQQCVQAELVIFSGLKADKLDDMQAMIDRGKVRRVFSAGSLAMALKKASEELEGRSFDLGLSQDPAHADKPYYIPEERIDQAKQMIEQGRAKGIEFVLPVDFVLADGSVSATIGPGKQQFDVGPQTTALFEKAVGDFINDVKSRPAGTSAVAFHNGVFGMFEDERFAAGTKNFIPQLKRMKEAGIEVYVGGGEGGKALERYGEPDWVTHCFTAGGTVLNVLGGEPVPYLLALKMAAS